MCRLGALPARSESAPSAPLPAVGARGPALRTRAGRQSRLLLTHSGPSGLGRVVARAGAVAVPPLSEHLEALGREAPGRGRRVQAGAPRSAGRTLGGAGIPEWTGAGVGQRVLSRLQIRPNQLWLRLQTARANLHAPKSKSYSEETC